MNTAKNEELRGRISATDSDRLIAELLAKRESRERLRTAICECDAQEQAI